MKDQPISRRSALRLAGATGLALTALGSTACSGGDSTTPQDRLDSVPDNFNPTGYPIVSEPTTIHFMTAKNPNSRADYNDVASWQTYQDLSNVTVDWGLVPAAAMKEKVNLALASGDYPEVLYGGNLPALEMVKYGTTGTLLPLGELIDTHMPNLAKVIAATPGARAAMTFPDGEIYGMPLIFDKDFLGLQYSQRLWIRQDWLDKVDESVPTTTEEYFQLLKKFKRASPNPNGDSIPYGDFSGAVSLENMLVGSYGLRTRGIGGGLFDADPNTDELRCIVTTDAYRDLLEFLHRMYAEGLMAKNIFSIERAPFDADAGAGVYGSFVTIDPAKMYGSGAKGCVSTKQLVGPEGDHLYSHCRQPIVNTANFSITDKVENFAVIGRWMDYFYSDPGCALFFMGIEGKSYRTTESGEVEYMPEIIDNPGGLQKALAPYVTYGGSPYAGWVQQKFFKGAEGTAESLTAAELLAPDAIPLEDRWPSFTYTVEESQQLQGVVDDITKFCEESRAGFITGETPFSNWGKYVDTLNSMGLEKYLEVQEAAVGRFTAAQ